MLRVRCGRTHRRGHRSFPPAKRSWHAKTLPAGHVIAGDGVGASGCEGGEAGSCLDAIQGERRASEVGTRSRSQRILDKESRMGLFPGFLGNASVDEAALAVVVKGAEVCQEA